MEARLAESSTVARWELALRIKKRRDELGLKADQISKELGFTRNFFSAVENERAMLATEKLELLMEMLRLDNVERAEFRELDRIARTRGWWEAHEELLSENGVRFIGLEQSATTIRTFDALVLPGLMQTGDYVKALLERDPFFGRVQTGEVLDVRRRRQKEVLGSGVQIMALVSEASLLQQWGGPKVQIDALQHISSLLVKFPNLTIRILPFDIRPGVIAVASTLALLDFDSDNIPNVVFQESLREIDLLNEWHEQYQRIRIAWEEGVEASLPPKQSMARISQAIDELESRD